MINIKGCSKTSSFGQPFDVSAGQCPKSDRYDIKIALQPVNKLKLCADRKSKNSAARRIFRPFRALSGRKIQKINTPADPSTTALNIRAVCFHKSSAIDFNTFVAKSDAVSMSWHNFMYRQNSTFIEARSGMKRLKKVDFRKTRCSG